MWNSSFVGGRQGVGAQCDDALANVLWYAVRARGRADDNDFHEPRRRVVGERGSAPEACPDKGVSWCGRDRKNERLFRRFL